MEPSPYLPKRQVPELIAQARADEQEAQVRQLRLALQWALLHPCPVGERPASWDEPGLGGAEDDGSVPLAGPGAPLVHADAPLELAAALGRPVAHAQELLGDVLELVFRLPRLWELVCSGVVPVWVARRISRDTHDLSLDAALFADRLVTAVPEKVGLVDAARLVHEARLHADPDRALADEEAALARRGVWLRHGSPQSGVAGVSEVHLVLDTADARLFDQSVARVAADLKGLGDTDGLDVRRARAVGVLADPQHALDLMSGRPDAAPSTGGTGSVDVVVHVTPGELTRQHGVAGVEGLGAVSAGLLADWMRRHHLAGGRVSVRAVIDQACDRRVDQHDPPPVMAEQVVLRDAHCVFPGCRRDSRGCDLDHTTPYVPLTHGGPPGQTRASNLAPLCRRHHIAKTHGAWSYRRLSDGSYTWTSPTGHRYDVIPVNRAPLAAHRVTRRA